MSERAAAFGKLNAPHTIEHKGKVYTISPVLTEGVLLRIEQKLYDRARASLKGARDLYTSDEYRDEAAKVRARFEAGDFAFTHPDNLAHLETDAGAVMLLTCVIDNADLAEIVTLLSERAEDVERVLNDVLELSLPKSAAPTA